MKVKENSEKTGLKLNIQKAKIMASCPITSWQIDGEKVETVTDFYLLWPQNHCEWWPLLGRKAMTKLDSILKSRDITLPTKVLTVKAMVFPVVMCKYDSRIIKVAEYWRIDAFELRCWRGLLGFPWTTRRSKQSIVKEINPEYSGLGGLMLTEGPVLWPPDVKSQLIRKDSDAGKDWGQEEKGTTEDEMVGWHHQLWIWVWVDPRS